MVSLRDVAEAAGVSIATASRALNGQPRVSAETAHRVKEIAEEWGYQVNPLARALKSGSDDVVGMIVPMISNPFFSMMVHEFENRLEGTGLSVLIADSQGEVDRERDRLNALVSRRVQGVVVVPASFTDSGAALQQTAQGLPLIQLDRRTDGDSRVPFVGVDNAAGLRQVLTHVQDRGAASVAYVGADDRTSVGRERSRSFVAEAGRLGLQIQPPIIDRFLIEFGAASATSIAERRPLPDAVIAGDDLIAAGLLSGFARCGIDVPGDLMVTGFDGTLLTDITYPSLTTAVQPVAALVSSAVDLLLRQIAGEPGVTQHVRLPTNLLVGGSTTRRQA